MPKQAGSTKPTMEDVFQALEHFNGEHDCKLALTIFPVMNDVVPGRYGLHVTCRNADGRVISEVTSSSAYWPNDKHDNWEAAALACILSVGYRYVDEYLPLLQYLSRQY